MNFLFGDSSESYLDFNYLAFLREALDCAVVLVEHEATLGSGERRRGKENEAQLAVQSIEELGRHASALFDPVVKEYSDSPVGRAATAITAAVRDVIGVETAKVKAALTTALEQLSAEDAKLRTRSWAALEKLLRAYDLPDADRAYDLAWVGNAAPKKIAIKAATPYGIDATLDATLPAANVFATNDMRVDKLANDVEIAAVEAGGWIKKSDKVAPYKLGRYFVTRIATGPGGTVIRLRLTQDATAPGFNLTARGADDFALERVGENHEKDGKARDYTIEERNRPALRALVARVEATAKAIGAGEGRALTALVIDGTAFAEHAHPQVVAERLMAAMAPTVKDIATHSSNPNELVLRRLLGDDRREEIFVSIAELGKKLDHVPEAARRVFAPLGIDRRAAPRPAKSPTTPPAPPPGAPERTRQTMGPANRVGPPPPPGALGTASGPVALPGMTVPPTTVSGTIRTSPTTGSPPTAAAPATASAPNRTSSPAIARTTSDTIDIASVEELPDDDVKPSTSGSVKVADLSRAIENAIDKSLDDTGAPKKPAAPPDTASHKKPAVVVADDD